MGCAKSGLRGGLKGQNVAHSYAWATFAARIDMAFEPNRRCSAIRAVLQNTLTHTGANDLCGKDGSAIAGVQNWVDFRYIQ